MSEFDLAGGPWGYRFFPASGRLGVDVYIEPGTFTGQTTPSFMGTIPDQTIYVGMSRHNEVLVERHNWHNQGAHYRSVLANFVAYPQVATVDYHNLVSIRQVVPSLELAVDRTGTFDITLLLSLLTNPAFVITPGTTGLEMTRRRALLALLASCGYKSAQKQAIATALQITGARFDIFQTHGVLLIEEQGSFTPADLAEIKAVLDVMPKPVVDLLNVIVMRESLMQLGVAGDFASGGIITLAVHAEPGDWLPYPSGRRLPRVTVLSSTLVHEIGHMMDSASVRYERDRYDLIYAEGAADGDAYINGQFRSIRTEEITWPWSGYLTSSATILAEVAERKNAVLGRKLAHVIDMLPCATPGHVPFFSTDSNFKTTVTEVPCVRGPSQYLGDDGMITSVGGWTLF